jgi:ABC-type methionine transport system ATPase subunit
VTHEIKVIEFLCNRVAIMADGAVVEELDLTSRPIHPQTDIGKFLFETSGGWDEDQEIGRFDRQGRAIPEGEDVL